MDAWYFSSIASLSQGRKEADGGEQDEHVAHVGGGGGAVASLVFFF
jgi:hypothetical protein